MFQRFLYATRSRLRHRLWKYLILLISVAFIAVACSGGQPEQAQNAPSPGATASTAPAGTLKRGGTLVLARPQEPQTFNPFVPNDNGSIWAIEQVCDSLVEPDATGEELVPGLAESWEISEDQTVYTFKLREAQFSNGKPLTAEDVVFSLGEAAKETAALGFLFEPIKSTEVVDPKTVKVTLKAPYAPFLSAMSVYSAAVVSKADYTANPEAFGQKPVCVGPFTVSEYSQGTNVLLSKNPNYWQAGKDGQPLPYLDAIDMRYIPDSNARVIGLKNGDFDVINSVPFNQAQSVSTTQGLNLEQAPVYKLDYVYLNHAVPPLTDKRIRQAMNYAANREAIMKAVYFNYGEIPNSYMPKVNFHSDAVKPIPFDIEQAKKLVQEAGYDGTPIQLMIDAGSAPSKQTGTILQQGWTQAGLNVELVEYDSGTAFSNKVMKGDYQAYVSYITSDINDTDELAILQADGTGGTKAFFSNYKNPEVTQMLQEARKASEPTKRAELYAKVQEIVYNDGYSVPLNFVPALNGYHDHVQDWRNITTGWWWLKDVWMNK